MTDRATSFLNTVRFPTSDVVEMMREQSAIEQILSSTLAQHQPLLAIDKMAHEQQERIAALQLEEQRKSTDERNRCQSCCDNFTCCSFGGKAACGLGCEAISCCS